MVEIIDGIAEAIGREKALKEYKRVLLSTPDVDWKGELRETKGNIRLSRIAEAVGLAGMVGGLVMNRLISRAEKPGLLHRTGRVTAWGITAGSALLVAVAVDDDIAMHKALNVIGEVNSAQAAMRRK